MSVRGLDLLLGQAVYDGKLRAALLRGPSTEDIADYDLTELEREFVLAARAPDLQNYAQRLAIWLTTQHVGGSLGIESIVSQANA